MFRTNSITATNKEPIVWEQLSSYVFVPFLFFGLRLGQSALQDSDSLPRFVFFAVFIYLRSSQSDMFPQFNELTTAEQNKDIFIDKDKLIVSLIPIKNFLVQDRKSVV